MKKQLKASLLIAMSFTYMLVVFQNCGKMTSLRPTSLSSTDDTGSLSDKTRALRQQHCASCHQDPGAMAEPKQIMNDEALVSRRWIVPGEPEMSPLYNALLANMPLGQPSLSAAEIETFARWIRSMSATEPAQLAISDGPAFDYGSLVTGSTADHSFTVTNSGPITAQGLAGSGLAAPFSFKGGAFPGEGGTCAAALPAGASCSIVVTYSPSNTGTFSDTIEINYDSGAGARTASRDVTGASTGVPLASLTLSDTPSYSFGIVSVTATPPTHNFTVTNNGAAAASALSASGLSASFSFAGGSYPGTGGTCATTLSAGASCTIVVRFAPTTNGAQNATLTVNYNDGASARTVSVSMTGTGAGAGPALYFSQIKAILETSNCMGCHGTEFNTYANIRAFKRNGETTPSINPGSSASRFITRITTESIGAPKMGTPPNGNLTPADRDKIVDWILAGAPNDPALPPASLTISDAPSYNFGSVTSGTTADRSFSLSNSGGQAATALTGTGLAAPFSFKGGSYPGTGGTCGTSLNAGASCTIIVTFAPTSVTTSSDTIEINYNNGSSLASATRPVTGAGIGAPRANLTISGAPLADFGPVEVGAPKRARTFTVTNGGGAGATAMSSGALTNGFMFKGGSYPGTGGTCAATLNAGANCTVVVEFGPTTVGTKTSVLTINYHDGGTNKVVSLNLTGLGIGGTDNVYYSQVADIFANKCNGCHGTDFNTYSRLLAFKRPPNTTAAIVPGDIAGSRFATRVLGDMGAQGSLTDDEKALILAFIADGAMNDPAGTITQNFRAIQGDRYYITSVLHKIYGTDAGTVVAQTGNISRRVDVFGAACHYQDTAYNTSNQREKLVPYSDFCAAFNSTESRLSPDVMPMASTVGESIRMSVCLRIANNVAPTSVALANAGLTDAATFTPANIRNVYQRFYPGQEPTTAILDSLAAIGNTAVASTSVTATTGKTKTWEGWRFIFLSMCLSPGWQAP